MSSFKATRSLALLGRNIKLARLSRRCTIADLAKRANISNQTLIRLEKGDPGVGIGNLAAVLAALGSPMTLADLMSHDIDAIGTAYALQAVPKRGRSSKSKPRKAAENAGCGDMVPNPDGIGF